MKTETPSGATRHTAPPAGRPWVRFLREWADLLVMLLFVLASGGVLWHLYGQSQGLYEAMAEHGALLQAQTVEEFRDLYAAEVVARVRARGVEATHEYQTKPGTIPLPASLTMELGKRLGQGRPGAHVRLVSEYPFPWRKDRKLDDFEAAALRALEQGPDRPYYRYEDFEGRPSLRYAVADVMRRECIACHQNHPDSPRRAWKEGDVRGALEVIRPLDDVVARSHAGMQWTLAATVAAYGVGLTGLGLVVHRLRRTTAALRSTEARAKAVVAGAADGILTTGPRGLVESFNASAARMFGYAPEEVIGRPVALLLPASDGRPLDDFLAGAPDVEVEGRRKDGGRFPLELALSAVDGGGPRTFTAIVHDLTERKRAEEALVRERYLLHTLMDNLPDSIYFKDAESRFLRLNRALAGRFGLGDPAQALGKTDFDFFTDEHARQAFEEEQELMRTGRPVVGEEEKETWPDGRVTWVSTTKMPLRDQRGRVAGTFGISRDVTARKQAEEALREAEERARLLLESSGEGIYGIDLQGRCTFLNRAAAGLLGYRPEEARGQNMHALIHHRRPDGSPYPVEECPIFRSFRSGRGCRVDGEVLWRGDGTAFPAEYSSYPLRAEGGEIKGAVVTFTDITERKRAEEELRQAKEAAETASRAKSDFLANMSHEIRTPMNGVLGMTELALDTDLTDEQREYLEMVKSSADYLLVVINDILDFSKIEAGKLDLERIEFPLRDTLDDTMTTLALRAHKKGLELACQIPPDVPDVLVGDPGRLRQVLVNLIGNAIKFTERGEVVVRVAREAQAEDAVTLHWAVSDTGIGIPADKQGLLFKAFSQVDSSTTRKYGGTGLGLAISSQLVQMMGGRAWLDSEVGKGSTFHFTARFGLAAGPAAERVAPERVELRGLPVLVVDDNATNRRILEEVLGHWGMRPTAVESGRAALWALTRARDAGEPFALVLLDSMMPEMDGFTLAEQIRRDPDLVGASLMMLSSADRRGEAGRLRELGIEAYLTKPVKQSDLWDAMVNVLGAPAAAGARRRPARTAVGKCERSLLLLLAEDNVVNQRLAVRLLEKRGHRVVLAGDGAEALAALERQRFDVVLMDVQMPGIDGFEATAAIRAREKASGGHVPIVAMTAHAMKGDRERCLATGMDGYVAKPLRAEELFGVVEGLAADGAGTKAPASAEAAFDEATAIRRVGGDRELLAELAGLFLGQCPLWMAEIRAALTGGDARALQRAAHSLRGSVGNFGAAAAVEAAGRLETMGQRGDLAGAEEAWAALEEAVARLRPALAGLTG